MPTTVTIPHAIALAAETYEALAPGLSDSRNRLWEAYEVARDTHDPAVVDAIGDLIARTLLLRVSLESLAADARAAGLLIQVGC